MQLSQIAAGSCHSVAISAVTGRLYTWGWAAHGQCGTGSTADVGQPTLCSALDGVPLAAAAAGMAHTLVVSRDGAVYSFGWNNNGQLGVGNCQQDASGAVQQQPLLSSLVPMLVEDSLLDQEHVVQVSLCLVPKSYWIEVAQAAHQTWIAIHVSFHLVHSLNS